jgi:Flp pilus assembly protein TadG
MNMRHTSNLLTRVNGLTLDERGVGVVEFALTAPLLAFLLLGVVDVSLGYAFKLGLERSAARAIEMVTAKGQVGSSYDSVRTEAATASAQPIGNVTLDNWLECDGTRQSSIDAECAGGTQIARYVSVSIRGTFQPLFDIGPLARIYGGQGMGEGISVTGDAQVRVQ